MKTQSPPLRLNEINCPPRFHTQQDWAVSEGPLIGEFIESQCFITEHSLASDAGELMVLRDFQKALLNETFALDDNGNYLHRKALWLLPRKQGKSWLLSSCAVWDFATAPEGSEIVLVARNSNQAEILFKATYQMLQANEYLAPLIHKNRQTLTNTQNGVTIYTVSRDADSGEGRKPYRVYVDEYHAHPDDSLYNVYALGMGARPNAMLIAISTAGSRIDARGRDSACFTQYQYGKRVVAGEIEDKRFMFCSWEPRLGTDADIRDPEVWKEANPGFGDIVSEESFADDVNKTSPSEFATKRLNIWVASHSSALPHGLWDSHVSEDRLELDDEIVLGFDGSYSNDSTALIAVRVSDMLVQPIAIWEKPENEPDWTMDSEEVLDTIRLAASQYQVKELTYDRTFWLLQMEQLEKEGVNTVEFPQSASRHIQTFDEFLRALTEGDLKHTGDAVLSRHFENMVLKTTPAGSYPTKDAKNSKRKIDAAMATLFAVNRALWHQQNITQPRDWLAI